MFGLLSFIIFFFFILTVVYLLKHNTIQNEEIVSGSIEEEEFEGDTSEFENDDCDIEVDEMPDDCLIYDDLFDEE